jgi:prolyl oligopeptidase
MSGVVRTALACVLLAATAPLAYPPAPHDGTVDNYYGTAVPDPYRPLESTDAAATREWIEAEAHLTRSYLDAIPQRAAIKLHLRSLLDYEAFGMPYHMHDQYFYIHNSGLQNQWVLYTMRGSRAHLEF